MQQRLLALGRAKQPCGAARIDFAFQPFDFAAANGAGCGHDKWLCGGGALVCYDGYHFGDDIARAPHNDGIAHAHVFALHLVFVMQGGVGYGYAAYKHGRELGYRGELAGAAHLHVNGLHHGDLFLRGVFVRHGPARLAADKAQLLLPGEAIDLVDHAVNIKRQAVAQGGHLLVKSHQPLRALHHGAVLAYGQAHVLKGIEHAALGIGLGGPLLHIAFAIGKKAQRALPGNGRV